MAKSFSEFFTDFDEATFMEAPQKDEKTKSIIGNRSGIEAIMTAEKGGTIEKGERNDKIFNGLLALLLRSGDESPRVWKEYEALLASANPPLPMVEAESIKKSALKILAQKKESHEYITPAEFMEREKLNYKAFKPSDTTEEQEADLFVKLNGGQIKYSEGLGFLKWTGTQWREDTDCAQSAIQTFVEEQRKTALHYMKECAINCADLELDVEAMDGLTPAKRSAFLATFSEKAQKAYSDYLEAKDFYKFAKSCNCYRWISNVKELVRTKILQPVEDWDSNKNLLNTPDGVYDLRDGSREDNSNGDLCIRSTRCKAEHTPKGDALWLAHLKKVFCAEDNNPEALELMEFFQLVIGASAFGSVFDEALFFAHGSGSNGKSATFNAIGTVLGDYSWQLRAEAVTLGFRSDDLKHDFAELFGKRFVVIPELGSGERLSTKALKNLCSTDMISAERKYERPFRFRPSHTCFLFTNHMPSVNANDWGTWRRIRVIPFRAEFKKDGKETVLNFAETLVQEAGSSILAWIIDGAVKAYALNFKFKTPKLVEEATGSYREVNDDFEDFVEERLVKEESARCLSSSVWTSYTEFCGKRKEKPLPRDAFYSRLQRLDLGEGKLLGPSVEFERKKWFKGIRLFSDKPTASEELL